MAARPRPRSALAELSKAVPRNRARVGRRLLHAVKERIEALRWHGNDQHGLLL